jgi:hypothetical protein
MPTVPVNIARSELTDLAMSIKTGNIMLMIRIKKNR